MMQLSPKSVQKCVQAALKVWNQFSGGTDKDYMAELLIVQQQLADKINPSSYERRLATNEVLLAAADQLRDENPEEADILKARYMDGETAENVAEQFAMSVDTVGRRQKAAIKKISTFVYDAEAAARAEAIQTAESQLPHPTYTKLFGIDGALETLTAQLLEPAEPWLLAVVGIGGLGKTALTDKLAREMIRTFHFYRVLWVRVESTAFMSGRIDPEQAYTAVISQLFTAVYPQASQLPLKEMAKRLQFALKGQPYLVIIDNLEDEAAVAHLAVHLNSFSNPSKFLLTSRARPGGQGAIYNYQLGELEFGDAAALLRHHASERNLQIFAQASEEHLREIYEVTGGNPYALKLVIGLLERLPLSQVLAALQQGDDHSVEKMYHYIYMQSWEILSEGARAILRMMPLVSARSGAPAGMLQAMSGLAEQPFWSALQELINRSLLEVRHQSIDEIFYAVHPLTETFVRTSIIEQGGSDEAS